jgi:hypothetical protein
VDKSPEAALLHEAQAKIAIAQTIKANIINFHLTVIEGHFSFCAF